MNLEHKNKLKLLLPYSLASTILISCSGPSKTSGLNPPDSSNAPQNIECPNGFSGMDNIDADKYLVVHDVKAHRDGVRVSVIETFADRNIMIHPVTITDWKHIDGRSSDLEAVCKIPGRHNEFLAAESGHWEGKYGRLFHLVLDSTGSGYRARVIHAYDLPEFDAKGPDDPHGDEFEGMECVATEDNKVLVFLGERGGSPVYPTGLMRWFTLDTASNTVNWTSEGQQGKAVNPPGVMDRSQSRRDITALHLDSDNALWATSAEDSGNSGPFTSFVYQIGTIESGAISLIDYTIAEKIMSGLKTEALAGPTSRTPESRFSVGTEDECLGGIWRVLN